MTGIRATGNFLTWRSITTVSFSGITTPGNSFVSFARFRATSLGDDFKYSWFPGT